MSTSVSPTFKIVGGDGREYGPIDLATLQQWSREGRIVRDSKVWDSRTSGWLRAGDITELAGIFSCAPVQPAAPPAMPVPLVPVSAAPRTNVFAIWSLVLSLLGFCCGCTPIAGIVCGMIALSQIKASRQGGRGMAIAGIVVGVVMLVVSALGLLLWLVFTPGGGIVVH